MKWESRSLTTAWLPRNVELRYGFFATPFRDHTCGSIFPPRIIFWGRVLWGDWHPYFRHGQLIKKLGYLPYRERSQLPLGLETSKNMALFLSKPRCWYLVSVKSSNFQVVEGDQTSSVCFKKVRCNSSEYSNWISTWQNYCVLLYAQSVPLINLPLFGVLCLNGSRCFPGAADTTNQTAKAGPTGVIPTHRDEWWTPATWMGFCWTL